MIRHVRQAWDLVSIYLPILLMALLALGTYWLVHSTPAPRAVQPSAVLKHEPDYFMRGFALTAYDQDGRVRSEVRGAEFRHYPDTDTIEIDRPQIRAFSKSGHISSATAERALSNGDGSEVQLIGNAVMVRESPKANFSVIAPRLEFRSEFLHAFMEAEKVRSHLPVILVRGNDRLSADAFEYSNLDRVLELRGRVRGELKGQIRK